MKGLLASTAVLLAVVAQPADAAFPGTDGPIGMERRGGGGARIAMVNADGTRDRNAVIAVGPEDRDPSWAPDGRRLAFTSTRDGNEEVYVLDTDSGAQTRLTFGAARDHDPAWSPDGSRLAFASDRDGNSELYLMPSGGGFQSRLTFNTAVDRQPAWSSTGRIAFASDRGGDMDLYAMDDDGGGVLRLTHTRGLDVDPSWAPAGDRLAYAHARDGVSFDLLAIGADGRSPRALSATPAVEHFPAWSPDGTRIAFVVGDQSSPHIRVIPADGPPSSAFVATGTDPNWGPLPQPVAGPDAGRTITVAPLDSRVLIAPSTSQPPATDPVLQAQLRTANEVPVGSSINASQGTVAIEAVTTTPDGPGTVGRAEVTGGVFTVNQTRAGEPTLRMRPGIRPCQKARASRVPPEARMRIRARGRFRTVGGYGRGAGRGTEWAMRERCDGTIFQVFEGTVLVHDYRRKRSFDVSAGRCYLAAVRRRPGALKPATKCPPVRSR